MANAVAPVAARLRRVAISVPHGSGTVPELTAAMVCNWPAMGGGAIALEGVLLVICVAGVGEVNSRCKVPHDTTVHARLTAKQTATKEAWSLITVKQCALCREESRTRV